MAQKCMVTSNSDLHAEDPIDDGASLELGAIAVLQLDAGVALLAKHGWSSFAPRTASQLVVEDVPLLVHVVGLRPQPTTGLLYAAMGPETPTLVAVSLSDRIAGYDPEKDDSDRRGGICRFIKIPKWC